IDDAVFDLASHLRLDQLAITSLAEAEFRFVAAGPCTVPGPAPSAHLLYQRVDGAGGRQMADASQWMSVFLIADGGAIDMPRPGVGPVIWRALTLEDASNAPDDALAALVAAESAVVCLVVLGREVDPAPVAE